MKICLAMVVTGAYVPYAQVLLKSLYERSKLQDLPMYIFHVNAVDHGYHTIEGREKELEPFYDNLIFQRVDYAKYVRSNKASPHYWSIELFDLVEYDRVIFIDADTLCLKPISDLTILELATGLGMCWETARQQYQAGLIVVDKININKEIYEALLKHRAKPGTFGRDQAVYNEYFKNKITKIDASYNVLVDRVVDMDNVKILHYIFKADTTGGKARLSPEQYDLWYSNLAAVDERLRSVGLK